MLCCLERMCYYLKGKHPNESSCVLLRKHALARCETQMWNWTHKHKQSHGRFFTAPPSSWPCFYCPVLLYTAVLCLLSLWGIPLRLYVLHNPPKPIRIKSTVTHSAIIAVFITLGCIFTGNTHSCYYILDRFITSAWTFRCRLLWCYCAFNVHSFFLKHSSITWRNSWSWLRWTCACGRCQIWFKKIMVSKTIHKVT